MKLIYLDHNSTTPLLSEVAAAMGEWQTTRFGNPSSQHQVGRRARQALEDAREGTGKILGATMSGADSDRVVFTSGGTEANNLALLGLAAAYGSSSSNEAIISAIEHPSIAACVEQMESGGWKIHRLGVTGDGVVDLAKLDDWLSRRTRFVSVMLANNETGVLQPVAEIARRCASLGVPMHTDAAQAVGKVPVDFRALGVSAMSVAPHKFHGPIGVGVLVLRHDWELRPLLFGGFQQEGYRPGTEAVGLAVGTHAALAAWSREGESRTVRLAAFRDRLESELTTHYGGELVVNAAAAPRLPHTSNLAFIGLDRQALLMALDLAGVCCSAGSACASGSSEVSAVLAAMGLPKEVLTSSLRFSVAATTTPAEVEEAIRRIVSVCERMRSSSLSIDGLR